MTATDELPYLLTIEQASTILGEPIGTLRAWRTARQGPPVARIGRRLLYRRDDLIPKSVEIEHKALDEPQSPPFESCGCRFSLTRTYDHIEQRLLRSNTCKACVICGAIQEKQDLHAGAHCWPCWSYHLHVHRLQPTNWAGWFQICERCGVRRHVLEDRPLCAVCLRIPKRWRETLRVCGYCGSLYRPDTARAKYCCGGTLREKRMADARTLGRHTEGEWQIRTMEYSFSCAYCGVSGVMLTKDHVVPVSRGGSDAIDNIVPACFSCNSSKGNRLLSEWRNTL